MASSTNPTSTALDSTSPKCGLQQVRDRVRVRVRGSARDMGLGLGLGVGLVWVSSGVLLLGLPRPQLGEFRRRQLRPC